jgi:GT2 family glycosyltransferase
MNHICDVVVLTWNQLEIIKTFIDSFLENTTVPVRLIIIDNGSSDGTNKFLASLKDTDLCEFKIIANEENKGFVGGMNQGIEASSAPFVCLANNDLIFTKGWLRQKLSVFESDAKIGVLNPNSNNLGVHAPDSMPLNDFAKELNDKYGNDFIEMPFIIGFCMTIKREVIDKCGGLSQEFYPMFFEDTDYSRKAITAGFLVGTARGSYVWHKEHASFKQMGGWKEQVFVKSRETFFKKWGRILRIAWVVNNYEQLVDNLAQGIELARQGNFVRFFVKDLDKEREEIFKEAGCYQHSEVHFIRFKTIFDLSWNILKKKKRYDVVITRDRFRQRLFAAFRYKVVGSVDLGKIKELKT